MTSPHSGFYVIRDKRNRIIAQSWAWVGPNGECVFDSLEIKNQGQSHLWKTIFASAAKKLIADGFSCVHMGTEGATPIGLWEKG